MGSQRMHRFFTAVFQVGIVATILFALFWQVVATLSAIFSALACVGVGGAFAMDVVRNLLRKARAGPAERGRGAGVRRRAAGASMSDSAARVPDHNR